MKHVAMLHGVHNFNSLTQLTQALFDHTTTVIYAKDADFRYLLINRQFEHLFHVRRDEIIGKTDFDIFPADVARLFRENDRRVLESGEKLQCEEVATHDDGLHRYLSMKFPLQNEFGSVYAVAGISTDITEQLRDRHQIVSLQNRQQRILESVGDGICGLDADGRVMFLNPAAERMLKWTTDQIFGKCHSEIVTVRTSEAIASDFSPLEQVSLVLNGQSTIRVQSALFRRHDGSIIPVEFTATAIHAGEVRAILAFRDTTRELLHSEIEQEMQTARRIQQSLNSKAAPSVPNFDFAGASIPCSKACGDYYDFIPWGNDRIGVVVGDVSGHGLGAALEMVETRAILRATMLSETDPVDCLSRLNVLLSEDLPDEMFVTLFLASLNTRDRTLQYASAGHDGMIIRANGEVQRLESTGTALGWNHSAQFSRGQTIVLEPGDIALLATDGMIETLSPAKVLFGRNRIIDVIRRNQARSAKDILDELCSAVHAFRGEKPQRDDVTAVVIKSL